MKFKSISTMTFAILVAVVFAVMAPMRQASAQTLSVTGLAEAPGATGSTVTGAVTCTNSVIDGVTNQLTATTYYGGFDASNNAYAWSGATRTSGLTNNMVYTNAIAGMLPGRIVYFNTQVQDLFNGSVWMSASGIFTDSAAFSSSYFTTNLPVLAPSGATTNWLCYTNGLLRGMKINSVAAP